jgi:predicted DsbA family dithiol-disulfide isomerase
MDPYLLTSLPNPEVLRTRRRFTAREKEFTMDLEVWSDIACSWCYVGKRRLEAALAKFDHANEINLVWRSFELDPLAPRLSIDAPFKSAAETVAETRGIPLDQASAVLQLMAEIAARDGLKFHFDRYRTANTFDGHRLLHLASEHNLQSELDEALLRGIFTNGELISDHATLRRLATDCGLPSPEVDDVLAGDRYAEAVRADERTAASFGVSGVPFFIIDRKMAVSGALPPEQLLQFLRRGWGDRSQVHAVMGGTSCGVEGCE